MRRLVPWAILVGIVVASSLSFGGPKVIPVGSRKFDHALHDKAIASSSTPQKTTVCITCHVMDGKGIRSTAKEHTNRCTKCHTDPATCTAEMQKPGPQNPQNRCATCHERTTNAAGVPVCGPKVILQAQPKADSFDAKYSHGKHIGFGASVQKDCATCHRAQDIAANVNLGSVGIHKQCTDCHNGPGGRSKLQFNDCAGCHGPSKGKTTGGGPSNDPFRLAGFNHQSHHAKNGNVASCTSCHTMLASDSGVPRPQMNLCQQTCHNGGDGKPFSAVGTKCTACHKNVNSPAAPNKTDLPFSHAKHLPRNVKIGDCTQCHSVKGDGNLEPPNAGKNHTPCSNSGCHQTEFMSRTTKICGVCHDKSVPWLKTVARAIRPASPEWFENMNHFSHLTKKGSSNAACADCHGDKTGTGARPAGHAPCAECHGKVQGAHPMSQCGTCHVQERPSRAPVSAWSVAATFKHDKHAMDPRSKRATNCIECHKGIETAKALAQVKLPAMQMCDGCHNGKQSFKTTGFECARCHTQPATAAPPAAPAPNASIPRPTTFTPTTEAMLERAGP
jgi:c(7)-type cytochrome triheme protein